MSRRQGVTWAATSVPEIRRQWCNALDQIVDRFSEGLAPPQPGTVGAGNRRLERTRAKLATEIEIMNAENRAEFFSLGIDRIVESVSERQWQTCRQHLKPLKAQLFYCTGQLCGGCCGRAHW